MNTQRQHARSLAYIVLALGAAGSLAAMGVPGGDAASRAPRTTTSHTVAGAALATRQQASSKGIRLVIVPSKTVAHYRVREQLTFFSLPTDAVGTTNAVSGAIVLDAQGRVVPAQSKITVDLRTLHTDQSRRDQYVQSNVLETATYPLAVLAVQRAIGLPPQLPTSGKITFTLVGNFTVHGVTRSTTWGVSVTMSSKAITGTASTHFAMTTFNITPPQIGPVLSVQDNVRLDIEVQMARSALSHT